MLMPTGSSPSVEVKCVEFPLQPFTALHHGKRNEFQSGTTTWLEQSVHVVHFPRLASGRWRRGGAEVGSSAETLLWQRRAESEPLELGEDAPERQLPGVSHVSDADVENVDATPG